MRNLMQYLSQEDFKEEGAATAALQDENAEQGAVVETEDTTVAPIESADTVVEGAAVTEGGDNTTEATEEEVAAVADAGAAPVSAEVEEASVTDDVASTESVDAGQNTETVKANVDEAAKADPTGESEAPVLTSADEGVKASVSTESEEGAETEAAAEEAGTAESDEVIEPAAPEVVEEMELELPEAEVVSEESVEEADEIIEEAREEQAAEMEEMTELADAQDEAVEEVASIENFMTILQHGLKTKSFSAQFAASTQLELERVGRLMGEDHSTLPSLEDFGHDALEQYYTTSLETFTGFHKRLIDVLELMLERMVSKSANKTHVDAVVKAASAVNVKIDDAIAKLESAKIQGKVDVAVKSIEKRLSQGDKFNPDLLGVLAEDQKIVTGIVTSGFSAGAAYINEMLDVLSDAASKGGDGKTGPIVAKMASMPYPVDKYPDAAFSTGILGGARLVRVTKEVAGASTREKIAVIGKNALPKIDKAGFRFAKASTVKADHTLVARVLKTAKVYTALADKIATVYGRKHVDTLIQKFNTVNRAVNTANATTWGENKDMATLVDQVYPVTNAQLGLQKQMVKHCLDVAETLVKFAELAMKAKPAAAE